MNCAILDDCRTKLTEARRSLRRAWYQLQVIRIVLEETSHLRLPPVGKRKCFATEGELLAQGLQDALQTSYARFENLADAVEQVRPYIRGNDDGKFPFVVLNLNKALDFVLRPDSSERAHRAQRVQQRIKALGSPP